MDIKVQLETQWVDRSEREKVRDLFEEEVQSVYSYFDIEVESVFVSLRDDSQPNVLVGAACSSDHVDFIIRYNTNGMRTALYKRP